MAEFVLYILGFFGFVIVVIGIYGDRISGKFSLKWELSSIVFGSLIMYCAYNNYAITIVNKNHKVNTLYYIKKIQSPKIKLANGSEITIENNVSNTIINNTNSTLFIEEIRYGQAQWMPGMTLEENGERNKVGPSKEIRPYDVVYGQWVDYYFEDLPESVSVKSNGHNSGTVTRFWLHD
jgi:hypothetical protein